VNNHQRAIKYSSLFYTGFVWWVLAKATASGYEKYQAMCHSVKELLYNNTFRYRGSRHLLFFGATVLLFSLVLYLRFPDRSWFSLLKLTLTNALFFFGYAYLTIFLLIPEFLIKRKIGYFILLFVLSGLGLSVLKLAFSETIFYAAIAPQIMAVPHELGLRAIVMNTKDMSFIVAVFCVAKYVKDFLYVEQLRKALETQKKNAQQKLLRSQFDPHFMFNTINNLYALSLLNPEQTKEVIHRIKIILNYMIGESQKEFVMLSQEIALVENYIHIEKLRYGKRLKISLNTEGAVDTASVPPMVLFFLVENCFRHGSSLDAGVPWINIRVKAEPGQLSLCTENSKPDGNNTSATSYDEGEGLKSLRKRLELLYSPGGYEWNIENGAKLFKLKIVLKNNYNSELLQATYR